MDYVVQRLLQEQKGSFFVTLPKSWVKAKGLKQSDPMTVRFDDKIEIEPAKKSSAKETKR